MGTLDSLDAGVMDSDVGQPQGPLSDGGEAGLDRCTNHNRMNAQSFVVTPVSRILKL